MSITPSPRRLGKKKVRDGCDAGLYMNIIICNRLLRSDSFFDMFWLMLSLAPNLSTLASNLGANVKSSEKIIIRIEFLLVS